MRISYNRMQKENITICEFCGKEKQGLSFVIGSNGSEPEWCMHEGTGKMSCPACYLLASQQAQTVIKSLVK